MLFVPGSFTSPSATIMPLTSTFLLNVTMLGCSMYRIPSIMILPSKFGSVPAAIITLVKVILPVKSVDESITSPVAYCKKCCVSGTGNSGGSTPIVMWLSMAFLPVSPPILTEPQKSTLAVALLILISPSKFVWPVTSIARGFWLSIKISASLLEFMPMMVGLPRKCRGPFVARPKSKIGYS